MFYTTWDKRKPPQATQSVKLEEILDIINSTSDSDNEFEDKINAFYYQLKSIGWTYKWIDTENLYLFTNGKTSVRVTAEEYSNMVEQSQEFCRRQLQRIILKSGSLLDAAHARTDTEITEEMKKHDDDIMDDENF